MNPHPIVKLFSTLAKIEGTSCNEIDVANFISTYLSNIGYDVKMDNAASLSGGNSGNIIATSGTGGTYCLMAHMDTARPTKDLNIVIDKKRIASDGTTILGADDRAGIAAILFAATAIAQAGKTANVTLAFTICEETNLAGATFLKLPESCKMAFVFDSSNQPGNFIAESYGAMRFTAEILGKAAHSGVAPEKGINAVLAAAQAISKIPQGRIDEETTANIGVFKGGTAINVVPEKAKVIGEVRSRNPKKIEQLIEVIKKTFQIDTNNHNATLNFEAVEDFAAFSLSKNSAIYKKAVSVLESVGLTPQPDMTAGGSDANVLNAKGIPAVNFGIGMQQPHANTEFILIKDLIAASEIAQHLISSSVD